MLGGLVNVTEGAVESIIKAAVSDVVLRPALSVATILSLAVEVSSFGTIHESVVAPTAGVAIREKVVPLEA